MRRLTTVAAVLVISCKKDPPPPPSRPIAVPKGALVTDPLTGTHVQKVTACAHHEKTGFDPATCRAFGVWASAKEGFLDGQADEKLVKMIEHDDVKVRAMAARKLLTFGRRYRTNKALAVRILDASKAERVPAVATDLGGVVARIRASETQTFDRVRELVLSHELGEMRRAIVSGVAFFNLDTAAAFELVRDLGESSEREMRETVASALWEGGMARPEETCKLWRSHLDDRLSDAAAALSAKQLALWGRCQTHYDALLESLEARTRQNSAGDGRFAEALGHVCADRMAPPHQRTRALSATRELATRATALPAVRIAALHAASTCSAGEGRALAVKLVDDANGQVSEVARRLVAAAP
jgi:hypothetical protein